MVFYMARTIFTGSGVALATPFCGDKVDFDKLGELIEFQIANKTDALVICGTTGEPATMPDEEHLQVISYAVEKTAGRVPVLAGTGSNDTAHGVALCRAAANAGADALLVVTPYYNKTNQKGLQKHFEIMADATDLPMILYNVPSRTGLSISIECATALAAHPNIVAFKEASGDLSYAAKLFAAVGDTWDIYSGNDDVVVPMMSLGAKGVISVAANIIPQQMHDMAQLYLDGQVEKSRELQLEWLGLINALFVEVNPIPLKTAMNLMGMQVGNLRLPLYDMADNTLAVLKKELERMNLLSN